MKFINLFSLALLGFSYNLQAQDTQNNSIVCEDKIIAGQIVKRCYYSNKPVYTKPETVPKSIIV